MSEHVPLDLDLHGKTENGEEGGRAAALLLVALLLVAAPAAAPVR
jgi:hypothetical protein